MAERKRRRRFSRVTGWYVGVCVKTSKEESSACYMLKKTKFSIILAKLIVKTLVHFFGHRSSIKLGFS